MLFRSDINAFAGPDGVIGIHTGLIQSVSSEDELASVMAHEIGHVTQEHLFRRIALQSESTLPQIASLIAAILIGIQNTDAGLATLMGSTAYQIEQQLKYSRQHEYEADFAGIKFLSLSGYDPHAMPDFFEKLANSYKHYGMSAPEILRTHPLTENRLAKAQARAASLASPIKQQDNTMLNLIQIRIESRYNTTIQNRRSSDTLECYKNILSQLNKPNSQKNSTECLQELINLGSQNYLLHALRLESTSKENSMENKGLPTKPPAFSYELFSLNESIVIRYAELLESQNKITQAITELKKFSDKTKYKNQVEAMISKLYAKLDKTPESYYHLALAQMDIGSLQRAAIYADKANASVNKEDKILKENITQLQEKLAKLLKNRLDD